MFSYSLNYFVSAIGLTSKYSAVINGVRLTWWINSWHLVSFHSSLSNVSQLGSLAGEWNENKYDGITPSTYMLKWIQKDILNARWKGKTPHTKSKGKQGKQIQINDFTLHIWYKKAN